ncbi:NAD-dependent epimerase/dehydratase family protein [Allohahella sp. A8]|uniref:NAD-dependent epimerase/dehydratase family protein n=1 Tax=Allohahella sp. A8 TaxID=3141461 RepID=UPI000C08EE15|nr:NAD-dependent dehydratase [Hahellaceae bacterium]|tara:strand:+ start:9963 stop:10949 length:987 start_codon:yes stop_codon:yes gene_type:complete
MKHIIFGGDGFLGTELTRKLTAKGEKVEIFDLKQTKSSGIYDNTALVTYTRFDVTDPKQFDLVKAEAGDVIYHFAAKLLVPIVPRAERKEYFWTSLYVGTENVLEWMQRTGLRNLIYYTTDMVYGHTRFHPRFEDHPREPLGPYGEAKYQTELLCERYREKGFNITIFRPRLIIGPGRLGILEKLFKLVDANLPVPTIGNGRNYYQFISVSDCAEAVICAVKAGFPNEAYNLGSLNPPTVNELLKRLIKEAGSKSFLVPTPAGLVKMTLAALDRMGKPIMDPEQYEIADETCVLDVSKGERDLGWVPKDDDVSMLIAAYRDYRKNRKA